MKNSEARGTGVPAGRLGMVVAAMTIGNAIILISQTAVPLALPSIMSELDVGAGAAQWTLTASILPLAGLMVLGGRLADQFGMRRMFVLGSLVFAAASLGSGLAPSFETLVAFRVLQGIGGALILPPSVAIVAAAARGTSAGRALGTLGGASAVAGAFGPILGGVLTSAFDWRAVMLVNVPLAALSTGAALLVVPRDARAARRVRVDITGAALLGLALAGLVFGVTQSQEWGWSSAGVLAPLGTATAAGALFVIRERRTRDPLVDFEMFRRYRDYAAATISQIIGGVVEMGLAVILPLVLILNLGLDPAAAGLALLPTTLPMVLVAPLAGRWYDKGGGKIPLVTGFALLAASGLALYLGISIGTLPALMPGLLLYGVGLSIVLTVNDPVSLDQIPEKDHGQASGVSATAEQFGGAFGIAVLYAIFHASYLAQIGRLITASPLADLAPTQTARLRDGIIAAEQTGLTRNDFPATLQSYLPLAYDASTWGYAMAFLVAGALALLGAVTIAILVRTRREDHGEATASERTLDPDFTYLTK